MNYQTTSFSKITLIIISLLLLPLFLTNAQSEKSMVKEKIKNIKGDIEKITITADGEEHVFSGEEAEELFKKLKLSKHKNISVKVLEGLDGNDKNIWVMKGDDDINLTTII